MEPSPTPHPDIGFCDGNIALVAGAFYFAVHRGILARHSPILAHDIDHLLATPHALIQGSPALRVCDHPDDLARFLLALYDGVSKLKHDPANFDTVSSILRLASKYRVEHIKSDILRGMSHIWPKSLAAWEFREADATDPNGVYKPRAIYPHPILIINLAKDANTPDLLPSAFYDLSRNLPSEIAAGVTPHPESFHPTHLLCEEDLHKVLRGREHASRYLSTFVVNHLESRDFSPGCVNRSSSDPLKKRICQAIFEATTFEILRDVNGVVLQRSCDPLFAMMDADLMQTRLAEDYAATGTPTLGSGTTLRAFSFNKACESCRMDFTASVDAAREDMWRKLPLWFGVDGLTSWP